MAKATCSNSPYTLAAGEATAANYSSILWTHSGIGTLTNQTTLTPTYTPAATESGTVTLTLTANGNGTCSPAVSTKVLTVTLAPSANAGVAKATCSNSAYTLAAGEATAANYSSILWTHNGTGTLTNQTTLTPTYTPAKV